MNNQKLFILFIMIFSAGGLFAAPLGTNYPKAPRAAPAEARQMVLDAARKYIGTPYVYGGYSSRGLDCSGFVCLSFADALGVTMPRSASGLHSWAQVISMANIQPGDLIFFRTGNTNSITHVGLYVGDRRFLHAASAGPQTGVIYSSLDEQYYINTFASVGRALPAGTTVSGTGRNPGNQRNPGGTTTTKSGIDLLVGAGFAPTWDFMQYSGSLIRGYSSQIGFGAEFGPWLAFGIEIRPEYDGALKVFRLPFTLSWGNNNGKLRFFAGPVLDFGDASLPVDEGPRWYSDGTSWLGTIGVTWAPFTIKLSRNEFAPYLEGAWQSYKSVSSTANETADFTASFRVSTGLRWRMSL